MSFDRRQSSAAPAAQSQTSRDAAPDSGPLRAMSGLGQQDAHLSPANQGYAAGAAAYAPVQLRGVGGPGGGSGKADGGETKGPKRREGHFYRVSGEIWFTNAGKNKGYGELQTGDTFIGVVDGKEYELTIAFAHTMRSQITKDSVPRWFLDGKDSPDQADAPADGDEREKAPAPAGRRAPSRGGEREHDDAIVELAKLGSVKVMKMKDLRKEAGKAPGGTPFDFVLRVSLDGRRETHDVHAVGDGDGYTLHATLSDALTTLFEGRLSQKDIAKLVTRTKRQMRSKVPASWL